LKEVLCNEDSVFLVMQYCPGGELYDIVRQKGPYSEAAARQHFQRLLQGLDFCHKKRIYHRDLKPENLFLNESGELCIGDFGLAALKADSDEQNLRTICGTPHFSAPEVMGGSKRLVGNKEFKTINTKTRSYGYDGAAADVWSCGCILYFLITGTFPFDGKNFVQLQLMVQKTEPYFQPGVFSKGCERIIRGMLMKDPSKRWTINKVMSSTWFKTDFLPVSVTQQNNISRFYDEEDAELADFMTPNGSLVVKEAGEASMSEATPTKLRPLRQLNAFEIINIAAFDVASIFDEDENTVSNATRFMSSFPPDKVQSAIIDAAKSLGTIASKRTNARIVFENHETGHVVTTRTYQVVPGICVYDFSRDEGGREKFHQWFDRLKTSDVLKQYLLAEG